MGSTEGIETEPQYLNKAMFNAFCKTTVLENKILDRLASTELYLEWRLGTIAILLLELSFRVLRCDSAGPLQIVENIGLLVAVALQCISTRFANLFQVPKSLLFL